MSGLVKGKKGGKIVKKTVTPTTPAIPPPPLAVHKTTAVSQSSPSVTTTVPTVTAPQQLLKVCECVGVGVYWGIGWVYLHVCGCIVSGAIIVCLHYRGMPLYHITAQMSFPLLDKLHMYTVHFTPGSSWCEATSRHYNPLNRSTQS